MNTFVSTLTARDVGMFERCGIPRELAEVAAFRVDSHDGADLIGRRSGSGEYSGLAFPYYWPGESKPREYRIRVDNPTFEMDASGALKERNKYLSPPGRGNLFYFHPREVPHRLSDPEVPIVITEGEKKALALSVLVPPNLVVGLPGVWNWRGVVGKELGPDGDRQDVKGVIPDFNRLAWHGRRVLILFDRDIKTNESVNAARRGLLKELRRRGALVSCFRWPTDSPNVNGIDDLIGLWGAEPVSKLVTEQQMGATMDEGSERVEPKWPELDPAALHGVTGEIVQMVDPHTESDQVAILVQVLAFYGNVIGRNAHFQVEADRHYTNLFVNLVGDTSKGRKGTSKGQVLSVFQPIDESWQKNCHSSGLNSGEGLIWAVRDEIEQQQPLKQGGKVVGYQSVVTDSGITDKRLLVAESEFASTLRVLGRDGNTLSAIIRNAWDSGNLRSLTKNSPATATNAHISIVGHVTANELRRYLDSTESGNGFANRFLWICVRRSKCLPEGGRMAEVDFGAIQQRLAKAVKFARTAGRIEFDDSARQIWHVVYRDLSDGKSGLWGAVTARAEAQVIRLALIYALLDCSRQIRQEHLHAAIAIWDYADSSAAYVFGEKTGDPDADAILSALRYKADGMTRTEISSLFGRHRTAGQIARPLDLLQREGRITATEIETSGRWAELWTFVH